MVLSCEKEKEKMDDIDAMFSHLLGEMDHLSQSLMSASSDAEVDPDPPTETTLSIGFTDLKESLNELEDHDLDALVADLGSKVTSEELPPHDECSSPTDNKPAPPAMPQEPETETESELKPKPKPKPEPEPAVHLPPPKQEAGSSRVLQTNKPQTKEDKIKLALEKLKEAKVRKLIIKVLMSDGSSKTMMVDERQTVREVLDTLFEKTHCDCNIDWSLSETNPELQIERTFEDHEYLVEPLSAWTRHSENKICFVARPQKYVMFKQPQIFYMWKKKKTSLAEINEQARELLIKENFGGSTHIVPDLEGTLFLKEDGKKVWKPRYFVLRASGIYYVPKGKTKSSSDLACFVRFEKVNIYNTNNYKQRYKAPTNFCFILKHPCLQRECDYIKFLCCEDEHALLLWLNSIRIAKYGTALYKNYQAAMKRTSTLQTLHCAAQTGRSNGHAPKTSQQSVSADVEDFPHEPPPDFIPPPPPGHTQI